MPHRPLVSIREGIMTIRGVDEEEQERLSPWVGINSFGVQKILISILEVQIEDDHQTTIDYYSKGGAKE